RCRRWRSSSPRRRRQAPRVLDDDPVEVPLASVARIVGMLGDLTPAPSDGAIRDRVGARRAAPQSRGELGAALVRSAADAADAKARMEERGVGDARALENLARACAGPQLHDRVEATVVWATERGRVRLRALLAGRPWSGRASGAPGAAAFGQVLDGLAEAFEGEREHLE